MAGTLEAVYLNFGSEFVFNSADSFPTSATTLDSTHAFIAYRDVSLLNGVAVVGTISGGTTGTDCAPVVFNTADSTYVSATALDSTHALIAYADGGNSNFGTAIVATISGGDIITYGTPLVFNSGTTTAISVTALDQHPLADCLPRRGELQFRHGHRGDDPLGDTIGYGAPVVFQSTTTDYISTTTLDPTTVLIAYQDASQPDAGDRGDDLGRRGRHIRHGGVLQRRFHALHCCHCNRQHPCGHCLSGWWKFRLWHLYRRDGEWDQHFLRHSNHLQLRRQPIQLRDYAR